MKNIFVIGSLLVAGSISQASTVCSTIAVDSNAKTLYTATVDNTGGGTTKLTVIWAMSRLDEASEAQIFNVEGNAGEWYTSAFGEKFQLNISMTDSSKGYLTALYNKQDYPVNCVNK